MSKELERLTAQMRLNVSQIYEEHQQVCKSMNYESLAGLILSIREAKRIFIHGAGRTGLAMRAFAMRLMHFGFEVYVVGEIVTPAIAAGDLLLVASGSGTTRSLVNAAETAVKKQAIVISMSTTSDSPLGELSSQRIVIPAVQKQDHGNAQSKQYAGSLFEQAVLLLLDAVIQTLWEENPIPAETLWTRHANLE